MSPDFRSLPLGFPEFWRIQLPQSPSRRCPVGRKRMKREITFKLAVTPFGVNGSIIVTTDGFTVG